MDTHKVIVATARIAARVQELGAEITKAYEGRDLDVVCLINGASMFCADLVRCIRLPVKQHSLAFVAYPEAKQSGEVRVVLDVSEPLYQRHVLVVEGIVVSGRTPLYVLEMLKLRRPASIALCALAVKPASLSVSLRVDYAAFELGSEVAVGYGVGHGPERTLPCLVEAPK